MSLIEEEGKKHYVLIKDFNTFIYDCLQAFSTAEISKRHINSCFKINEKEMIKTPKKGENIRFKRYGNKVKSAFMIYVDFESFIVPKDNGKQNPSQQVLYEQV